MALKLKFPILLTEDTQDHYTSACEMVDSAVTKIKRFNNLPVDEKPVVKYRGKTKQKVIKNITHNIMMAGELQTIIIRTEEYKEGVSDMYVRRGGALPTDLQADDQLGSRSNYALLYPMIECDKGKVINRWVVFIYDDATKDDADLINTIKSVVSKVFNLRYSNVIQKNLSEGNTYPEIEVVYTQVENEENEGLKLQQYLVTSKVKTEKTVIYQNVPVGEEMALMSGDEMELSSRKKIKLFFSPDKKSYRRLDVEKDSSGIVSSSLMAKYSYSVDIEDVNKIYEPYFMEQQFLEVIRRFLSNEL